MQLNRLSFATLIALGNYALADDISLNMLYYHERGDRVSAVAPYFSYNKEDGTDSAWHVDGTFDVVSGATPTWTGDGASGASADITTIKSNLRYENVTFNDQRGAINTNFLTRDEDRNEYVIGGAFSKESDFQNLEGYGSLKGYFDEFHNTSYTFGLSVAYNYVGSLSDESDDTTSSASAKVSNNNEYTSMFILGEDEDDESSSTTVSTRGGGQGALAINSSITQNINDRSVVSVGLFGGFEAGFLSNPHQYIVRDFIVPYLDYDVRPSLRLSGGGTIKYNAALFDFLILNTSYRYYIDNWSIDSHTVNIGLMLEIGPFTINPEMRYYNQSEAYFYTSGYVNHTAKYGSSDERLSDFSSITYLLNSYIQFTETFRYNIGVNYFSQTTGLEGYFITTGVQIEL